MHSGSPCLVTPRLARRLPLIAVLHTLLALPSSASLRQSGGGNQPTAVPPAPTFHVTPAAGEVAIDGVMDEGTWGSAVRVPLAYESFPGDNVTPPVETDCRITYDVRNLYLGCRAFDPDPSAIRAHFADRDDLDRIVQDDHVVILLDPFNDQRRGFLFGVNALGVQMDGIVSGAAGVDDFSWDAIWASAGRITPDGYVVEVAIPFGSLRFRRTEDSQSWGFFIERSYPRRNRQRMRSMPTDRSNSCLLCQANKLVGFEGVVPATNLEFYPTATSSRTDSRPDIDGPMVAGDLEVDPGLDIRWGVTPNLSLNATANPDFSQVEADAAQLDVNKRFALQFPEKRPFFLEGADFFATPIEAVFTRTVADPAAGAKLSGKAGRNAVALFVAHDRVTNLLFPANQGSQSAGLAQNASTGVVRYRRDLGRASYLGLLYTGREGSRYHNRVAGMDGFLQLSPANTLRFQYLASDTEYPDSVAGAFSQATDAFVGGALHLRYQHASRSWTGGLAYEDRSPDFRTDAGFVPRVDERTVSGELGRIFWGTPGGWFTRWTMTVGGRQTMDHDGILTDRSMSIGATYLGPGQTEVEFVAWHDKIRVRDVEHEFSGGGVRVETQPSGSVRLQAGGILTGDVDYINNRTASGVHLGPSAQFSIGRPITLNLSHIFERVSFTGGRIFTANLFQARIFYHFGVRTFVRTIVQFEDVSRNAEVYVIPVEARERRLLTQFLFSYKLNPQTVAFVGYSDSRSGTAAYGLTPRTRTFFAKFGYAWRPQSQAVSRMRM